MNKQTHTEAHREREKYRKNTFIRNRFDSDRIDT